MEFSRLCEPRLAAGAIRRLERFGKLCSCFPLSRPHKPQEWCENKEVRPHPGPLPQGEGETVSASGQNSSAGFAVVQDFNAQCFAPSLSRVQISSM